MERQVPSVSRLIERQVLSVSKLKERQVPSVPRLMDRRVSGNLIDEQGFPAFAVGTRARLRENHIVSASSNSHFRLTYSPSEVEFRRWHSRRASPRLVHVTAIMFRSHSKRPVECVNSLASRRCYRQQSPPAIAAPRRATTTTIH